MNTSELTKVIRATLAASPMTAMRSFGWEHEPTGVILCGHCSDRLTAAQPTFFASGDWISHVRKSYERCTGCLCVSEPRPMDAWVGAK